MIKPNKICGKCKKIKNRSCVCPKPKPFENIKKDDYNFYNSTKWRKYSKHLRRLSPLCVICLKNGDTNASEVVDHIKPISKGGDRWNEDNLQCICKKCHNRKTAKSF